ncbi:hypothetical protein [Mangrovitalea sediminis]|uniref:hypothetical protein n=1 Tax=Mangrovitalea sediminis TaxID=1982043 RepID=UPI000BE5E4F1|nr:hypothetical protein [Mangrovitalea sediminis]
MALITSTYSKDIYYILVGVLFIPTAITWISFARLSMARIEREMHRDGLSRPSPWDAMGARVLWYATAIAFNSPRLHRADEPFIDVATVRRYAKPFDRMLGLVFLISGYSFLVVGLVGGLLIGL